MKVENLKQGEFAIAENGTAVLCLSDWSFAPKGEGVTNVVNLGNGRGGYPTGTDCRKVDITEAFEVALQYRNDYGKN